MQTSDGEDISAFDVMRWYAEIGTQNLLLRDLRANFLFGNIAAGVPLYWTTDESISYSNNNAIGSGYDINIEDYMRPVSDYLMYTDEPFHMEGVVFEDFCDFGEDMVFSNGTGSPNDYVQDSLRIIRIVGRAENDASDETNYLIDNNFLMPLGTEDAVYRADLTQYPGMRGLTIEEFFDQLQSEGQFSGYSNWQGIIQFDYVQSELEYGGTYAFDQTQLVPHIKLELGDLHFNGATRTISAVYTTTSAAGASLAHFDITNINAENLPYAYIIYYDTKATDAWLYTKPDNSKEFKFFNVSKVSYSGRELSNLSGPIVIAYEGSGGFAEPTYLSIKKVDEDGNPLLGVEFTLTKPDTGTITRTTTQNGTFQFPINSIGTYILTETGVPSGLVAIEPMTIAVSSTAQPIDLTGFNISNDITFDSVSYMNTVVNFEAEPTKPLEEQDNKKPVISNPETNTIGGTPPPETTVGNLPHTGDSNNISAYLTLMGLSVTILGLTLLLRRITR